MPRDTPRSPITKSKPYFLEDPLPMPNSRSRADRHSSSSTSMSSYSSSGRSRSQSPSRSRSRPRCRSRSRSRSPSQFHAHRNSRSRQMSSRQYERYHRATSRRSDRHGDGMWRDEQHTVNNIARNTQPQERAVRQNSPSTSSTTTTFTNVRDQCEANNTPRSYQNRGMQQATRRTTPYSGSERESERRFVNRNMASLQLSLERLLSLCYLPSCFLGHSRFARHLIIHPPNAQLEQLLLPIQDELHRVYESVLRSTPERNIELQRGREIAPHELPLVDRISSRKQISWPGYNGLYLVALEKLAFGTQHVAISAAVYALTFTGANSLTTIANSFAASLPLARPALTACTVHQKVVYITFALPIMPFQTFMDNIVHKKICHWNQLRVLWTALYNFTSEFEILSNLLGTAHSMMPCDIQYPAPPAAEPEPPTTEDDTAGRNADIRPAAATTTLQYQSLPLEINPPSVDPLQEIIENVVSEQTLQAESNFAPPQVPQQTIAAVPEQQPSVLHSARQATAPTSTATEQATRPQRRGRRKKN
jgi:hypothetical protein